MPTLIEALEQDMADADAMLQETMNWCAAQIGIEDEDLPISPNLDRECRCKERLRNATDVLGAS
jgi:3-methyladenine DNA glycosylase AlkD